ncbi:DUF302 domain-containing protein [Candidatus Poribacteria bacterium]|nr:DUF302 domain-containing protein [Candidatus Poribacteria bacterium]
MHKITIVVLSIFLIIAITSLSFAPVDTDKSKENKHKNGLVKIKSNHNVKQTADNAESILNNMGLTVFNRINHAENAAKVDEELRPTELLIFGNPKIGTKLMNCSQSIAIDLPQKILIWEDEKENVWLAYNNPRYLARRHNIKGCNEIIKKVNKVLKKIAMDATAK